MISRRHLRRLAQQVAELSRPLDMRPVVFFNASARLGGLSQNAAFSLLAAWGLRLEGVPILHFVCKAGMTRCVLGINPDDAAQAPPCAACVSQSRRLYRGAEVRWLEYRDEPELRKQTEKLSLDDLSQVSYDGLPLGQLVLPSVQWALRRNDLMDDEDTRFLFREAILSAHNVAREFETYLAAANPQAVVVFNGTMFPEAVVRRVARNRGIRVITHEVGLLPMSAFFTDGQATAYPMEIPKGFALTPAQDRQLDDYLTQRFQGKFSMAGIRFWREMQQLDDALLKKMTQFKMVVPVFSNVIFDTSQVHANKAFANMFAWLNAILPLIRDHPETLFVIRAHPDEKRPGTRKQSRQSVAGWVAKNGLDKLPNVVFIDSDQYLSSYALIKKAHFVMVYNSSIGLEASIMGKPVLCAGAARYTQYPTVHFPATETEYIETAKRFLKAESVEQPTEFVKEARRVLYFQLFKTSLPFANFLEPHSRMGYVNLKEFVSEDLMPVNSAALEAIKAGILEDKPFLV